MFGFALKFRNVSDASCSFPRGYPSKFCHFRIFYFPNGRRRVEVAAARVVTTIIVSLLPPPPPPRPPSSHQPPPPPQPSTARQYPSDRRRRARAFFAVSSVPSTNACAALVIRASLFENSLIPFEDTVAVFTRDLIVPLSAGRRRAQRQIFLVRNKNRRPLRTERTSR